MILGFFTVPYYNQHSCLSAIDTDMLMGLSCHAWLFRSFRLNDARSNDINANDRIKIKVTKKICCTFCMLHLHNESFTSDQCDQ